MKKEISTIYNNVMGYCDKEGYTSALKKSFTIPEAKRFDTQNITKVGLDILDAVHCVYDKKRTVYFLECINDVVKKDTVVIEAGVGTGVLSFMSAYKGARVYAVELNKNIYTLAKSIRTFFYDKNILIKNSVELTHGNAFKYSPKEKADVIISENIYTGMFYEKQVQIMNHLLPHLKRNGIVIPSVLTMGIALVNASFPNSAKHGELFVVNEHKDKLNMNVLSNDVIYSTLDFKKKNSTEVDKKIAFTAKKMGVVNGVLIWSTVMLPNGKIIKRQDTIFLNNDILLSLGKTKNITKGDIIIMHLKYTFGSSPRDALFDFI